MTDPKGGVWRFGYDTAGNRISTRDPLGQQTSYSYDAAGRVTSQTEPNGLVTTYSYDARGRLVSLNRGGEVSTFSYTPTGQLAGAALPNGFQASYSYDAAQRLTGATDNRGNSVNYSLDAMGNRIREEVKDATGAIALVTGRIINSLNKVAAIQGSVGQTTQLAYDANGEPIAQTDPLNQTTRQTLDGLRRPTCHHLPGQHLRQPGLEPAGPAHPGHRPQGRANQLPDQRLRRSGERNQPGHRHHPDTPAMPMATSRSSRTPKATSATSRATPWAGPP